MIRWLAAELDRGEGNWGTLLIRLFADNRRCTPPSANSANPPFVRPTELPSLWKGVLKGGSENYSKGPTSRLCTHGYGLERSWERDEGCIVSVPLSWNCASDIHMLYITYFSYSEPMNVQEIVASISNPPSPHLLWRPERLSVASKPKRKSSRSLPGLPRILNFDTSLVSWVVEFKWIKVLF